MRCHQWRLCVSQAPYPIDISTRPVVSRSHYVCVTWLSYHEADGMMVEFKARSQAPQFKTAFQLCKTRVDISKEASGHSPIMEFLTGWVISSGICGDQKRSFETDDELWIKDGQQFFVHIKPAEDHICPVRCSKSCLCFFREDKIRHTVRTPSVTLV